MAEIKVTADGATVTTQNARNFVFGAQGGIEKVTTGSRTRHLSAEDLSRLKNVGEPGHPDGHPLFEGLEIAVKNAGIHAAGESMTVKHEANPAPQKQAPKPDGWKH